jgi:hypothetical protein
MVADGQTEHDASQSRREVKPPGHSCEWWSSRAQPTLYDVPSASHRACRHERTPTLESPSHRLLTTRVARREVFVFDRVAVARERGIHCSGSADAELPGICCGHGLIGATGRRATSDKPWSGVLSLR